MSCVDFLQWNIPQAVSFVAFAFYYAFVVFENVYFIFI